MIRILFFCMLLSPLVAIQAQVAAVRPAPPQIPADAYLLMDFASGEILVEHNADLALPPASLNKIMTSYVVSAEIAAGRVSDADEVLITRNAWSQNPLFQGSSLMWIEVGKTATLEDLHRGVIISSGNDATVAVAEHVAGSEDAFAAMMNAYAESLGLTGTRYGNSHGLPHPDQYTTARDLANLAVAFIRNFPETYAIYKEREFTYNGITQQNRNLLLNDDPSVDGLKTGYTREAGYGLVASAERDGMRLVSVVLGSKSVQTRRNETRGLLNYGFRFFESVDLLPPDQQLAQARVWKGSVEQLAAGVESSRHILIPRGKRSAITTDFELSPALVAPLARGDVVGTIRVTLDGEVLATEPLVALHDVERAGFFRRLLDGLILFFKSLFGAA